MSRGLGTMQRDILRAYATARPDARGMPRVTGWGTAYDHGEVYSAWLLRVDVVTLRGGWCETPCYTPAQLAFYPHRRHTPHIEYAVVGWGFDVSFARALHTLVKRGVLVAVEENGASLRVYRGRHIRYVVRGKC